MRLDCDSSLRVVSPLFKVDNRLAAIEEKEAQAEKMGEFQQKREPFVAWLDDMEGVNGQIGLTFEKINDLASTLRVCNISLCVWLGAWGLLCVGQFLSICLSLVLHSVVALANHFACIV